MVQHINMLPTCSPFWSGQFAERLWACGQIIDCTWGRSGGFVEDKWRWVICGLLVYKVLTGCGEFVDFTPTNYPHFLCPAKVK